MTRCTTVIRSSGHCTAPARYRAGYRRFKDLKVRKAFGLSQSIECRKEKATWIRTNIEHERRMVVGRK